MRRQLIPTAAAVVLVANVWGLVPASRNRAEARGGRLELSEQELRLEPAALESTAILLDLQWRTRRDEPDNPVAPGWLDTRKLTELGFDCRMPVDNPSAKDHYRSMAARPAYMVLELAAVATTNGPQASKRLVVVDAGPEPAALRARHPDANRFAIAHGVVGLVYLSTATTAKTTPSRLHGWKAESRPCSQAKFSYRRLTANSWLAAGGRRLSPGTCRPPGRDSKRPSVGARTMSLGSRTCG